MRLREALLELAQKLPASARARAEQLLHSFQPEELDRLLAEIAAAARAAIDAETRARNVDRLLARLARAAGVELSPLESTALRVLLLHLIPAEART